MGDGSPGGKARGLLQIADLLASSPPTVPSGVVLDVPALVVVQTGIFDRFMDRNRLWAIGESERDDRKIARAFQSADLPAEIVGDLRAIVAAVKVPLAVRSSSLLEDALQHPSAGVYATKMIPNDQHDADARFRRLTEAIKLVYASMFFESARRSIEASGEQLRDEKMAVIIQEIVGRRHGVRFYPDVSGVARSLGFYRSGAARPEDAFASLALGLGKTIVDGEIAWPYSPAYPHRTPPFASPADLLDHTQTAFWAVSMTGSPRYDPVNEVEYLVHAPLADAYADGTLAHVASTYDAASDRLRMGARGAGPWAVTFAPLLVGEAYPINRVVRDLLALGRTTLGAPVEIEYAFTLTPGADPACRCGFLQVRPMAFSSQPVAITAGDMASAGRVAASDAVLGNGASNAISDIVFVRRDRFDFARSRTIAAEIAELNRTLVDERRPYLLIGFGRWGSSDPWLGIPLDWASISGARAIIETTLPSMHVDPSQGSHFFHNLSGAGVLYFSVRPGIDPDVDWAWLESLPAVRTTPHVHHVRTPAPLSIKVDGRTGRGVIRRAEAER